MVREAVKEDLDELLNLYLFLHEKNIPKKSEHLENITKFSINLFMSLSGLWKMFKIMVLKYLILLLILNLEKVEYFLY